MAIKIPYEQTQDRQVNKFQTSLAKALMPITSNPIAEAVVLTNIKLVSGSVNIIPTTLNRTLQGWIVIRQRAQAEIWDSQDSNTTPALNLRLNTSANVTVDLMVF